MVNNEEWHYERLIEKYKGKTLELKGKKLGRKNTSRVKK